ncbi:actinorhodin polyketide synthase [Streptomyces sp. NPDC051000]|uniref:actinorhodin polyketide synthase n=1 Tax=unclassified Streptomyces TaxID=2593676 RepID=UPI003405540D
MDRLELTDLTRILRAWGGEEEGVELDDDVRDLYWVELGYDCLSVLQTTGYLEQRFDIAFDEEAVEYADTPRRYLDLVNHVLGSRAAV